MIIKELIELQDATGKLYLLRRGLAYRVITKRLCFYSFIYTRPAIIRRAVLALMLQGSCPYHAVAEPCFEFDKLKR